MRSVLKLVKRVKDFRLRNQHGFTLIEIMSVLVIMGVMSSVAVKKFDLLSNTAGYRALQSGVKELNIKETLVWTKIKLSDAGWASDAEVYETVDKNIGVGFSWNPPPDINGGRLYFKSQSIDLKRTASTRSSAGSWK